MEAIKIEKYTFADYIGNNYVTLLMLLGLLLIFYINRRAEIGGIKYFRAMIGIVFMLTLCEALEDICDIYGLSVRVLYLKTALVYWFYPLIAMLELYLVVPMKRKLLWAVPYAVNALLVLIDLFDTRLIYYFGADHTFHGGALSWLPMAVLVFYVLMLGINSVLMLGSGYRSKGTIALFMTVAAVVTAIGEGVGFARGLTEEVTAFELLIYYFFLSAIGYSEAQETIYENRLELERQRLKLLVVQIQPHFIFNVLTAIQSLCYTDSMKAAECIDVFGDYLRANINSISSDEPIEFDDELEHIRQYIDLEKASRDDDFTVIYELRVRDFKLPPLTVQPIVENAVKHGALSRRDGTGFVKIMTEERDGGIVITVTDNGSGAGLTAMQKEHKSIGIENVRQRLKLQCGGSLDISLTPQGSVSVITIPMHNA